MHLRERIVTYDSKKIAEQLRGMFSENDLRELVHAADKDARIESVLHDELEITFSEPGAGKRFLDALAARAAGKGSGS